MDKPKKGLKKLKAIEVKTEERFKVKELRYTDINKKERKNLAELKISFPQQSTLIPIRPKLSVNIIEKIDSSKMGLKSVEITSKFEVNYQKNALLVTDQQGNIIKYDLDTLVSENSRNSKSIDKKNAIELANVYLKLGIKPQLKKEEFIKRIREHIKLPPE
jgi:hypothetical protein